MRVFILGAGAVGGVLGARLIQTGVNVTFGVRPARAAQLSRRGLIVQFPDVAFERHVSLAVEPHFGTGYDAVLLACKAYDLEAAMQALDQGATREALIVPLLNGVAHLEELQERFDPAQVAGGTCHLATTVDSDGTVRQMGSAARVALGALPSTSQTHRPALAELVRRLATTPVECCLSDDILQDLWEKYAFLATLAAATCLMRGPIGDIVAIDNGLRLVVEGFDACAAAAAAAGHPLREPVRTDFLHTLTQPGSLLTSSMLRDVEAGRRIELEHVIGDMHRRLRALGVKSTLLDASYTHLQVREACRAREQRH